MEGLHRVAGVGATIDIAGKEYRCSSVTLGVQAEIEAYIVSKRSVFMEDIVKGITGIPAALQEKFIAEAVKQVQRGRTVSKSELMEFLGTFEGNCYLLWAMIRDNHPEVATLEDAKKIGGSIPLIELELKLDAAAGFGDEKNSAGPATSRAEAKAEE